jgi:hypothetical protein
MRRGGSPAASGHADLEHALVEGRGDRLGIDALGQGQRAGEGPERALDAVEALLALLVLGLALARDGEHRVFELDADVFLGHARKVGAQHEVLVGLDEIHGRHPAAQRAGRRSRPWRRVERRVEEPVHLALQGAQLPQRLPADDGHDAILL